MSRLLASSNNVIGSSQDLTTRIVRLRADGGWVPKGNAYSPGEWRDVTMSASPISGNPGSTVSVNWQLDRGAPMKIEGLYLKFSVTNASGTDTLRTHNPLAFLSGMKLGINGTTVMEYTSNLELRLLHAGHLLTRHNADAIYHDLADIRSEYGQLDQGTLTALDIANGTTQVIQIPLFQLFPWLNNTITGAGVVKTISLDVTFRAAIGSAAGDGIDFINTTAAATLYSTQISFSNIGLRAVSSAIMTPALLQMPSAVRYPLSRFHSKSYTLDLSVTATQQTIRLAEALPRSTPIIRTWAIVRDVGAVTAFNDADGGSQLRSGPGYLSFSLKRTGSTNTLDCLTQAEARRFFIRNFKMSTGRSLPPELLDGSGNLGETWCCVPLIDWRGMFCDNNEVYSDSQETTLYGGLNTKVEDWELTVQAAAAALHSAAAELWIVNETMELGLITADGLQFARLAPEA